MAADLVRAVEERLAGLLQRHNLRTHPRLDPEGSRMVAHHRVQPVSAG